MFAYRDEGYLVIKIPEEHLIKGVSMIPESQQFKVTDKGKFLNFFMEQIFDFGDNGDFNSCSNFTKLIDGIIEHAVESDAGIEEDY